MEKENNWNIKRVFYWILVVILTALILLVIIGIFYFSPFLNPNKPYEKVFCEEKGGEYDILNNECLILEDNDLIKYDVVKFKGEYRLAK